MATGVLDTNGIWLYGEDDPASPVSSLLNLGQGSVSTAEAAAKARLSAPEAVPVWTKPTLHNGWVDHDNVTFQGSRWQKRNGVVYIEGLIKGGTMVDGTATFVFPVGARPSKTLTVSSNAGGVFMAFDIVAGDSVMVRATGGPSTTAHTSINCSFVAA